MQYYYQQACNGPVYRVDYLSFLSILPLVDKPSYVYIAAIIQFLIIGSNLQEIGYALSNPSLIILWAVVLLVGVPIVFLLRNKLSLMVTRKLFHFIGSVIFTTGIVYDQKLLNIAFLLIFSAFILIEVARHSLPVLDPFFLPFAPRMELLVDSVI